MFLHVFFDGIFVVMELVQRTRFKKDRLIRMFIWQIIMGAIPGGVNALCCWSHEAALKFTQGK
jgi:hypothetical protein